MTFNVVLILCIFLADTTVDFPIDILTIGIPMCEIFRPSKNLDQCNTVRRPYQGHRLNVKSVRIPISFEVFMFRITSALPVDYVYRGKCKESDESSLLSTDKLYKRRIFVFHLLTTERQLRVKYCCFFLVPSLLQLTTYYLVNTLGNRTQIMKTNLFFRMLLVPHNL